MLRIDNRGIRGQNGGQKSWIEMIVESGKLRGVSWKDRDSAVYLLVIRCVWCEWPWLLEVGRVQNWEDSMSER